MALVTLISLGIQAANLARGLKPQHTGVPLRQFATRYVSIKSSCEEPITVSLEYYACGVDGQWEWSRWGPSVWDPGETASLNTGDSHKVHAAKVRLQFKTAGGITSDKTEFTLVSEPYLAPERDIAVINCEQPQKVFDTRDIVIENATEEPIRVSVRYSSKSAYDSWCTSDGHLFDPGERFRLCHSKELIHARKACIRFVGTISKRNNVDEWLKATGKSRSTSTAYGPEHVVCGQKYGGKERGVWTYVCKW